MESKPYSSGRAAAIPDNLQLDLPHNTSAKNITTLFLLSKHKIQKNLSVWCSFKFFQIMVILKPRHRNKQKDKSLTVLDSG